MEEQSTRRVLANRPKESMRAGQTRKKRDYGGEKGGYIQKSASQETFGVQRSMAEQKMSRSTYYEDALNLEAENPAALEEIAHMLEQASQDGDDRAIYALATWFLHGKYFIKDIEKALFLLHTAAEAGNADALFDLAYSYESGTGVLSDKRRAFLLYVQAALAGDKQAVYEVSRCYWYGVGTAPDWEMSDIWRKRAEFLGVPHDRTE